MRQSFTEKLLTVTFTLGTDQQSQQQRTFTGTGKSSLSLSGLRAHARISRAGAPVKGELDLQVWGMTLSQMNDLITQAQIAQPLTGPNFVTVEAGDAEGGQSLVWSDAILNGWIDLKQPEVSFRVTSMGGQLPAMTPAPGLSYPGSVAIASVMSTLAQRMNLTFENHGVNGSLRQPHFFGTAYEQARQCAEEGGFNMTVDNGVLAIWPAGGARNPSVTVALSPDTGMIGYPTFNPVGITVKTVYNKDITFGGQIQVTSQIAQACGVWSVQRIDHDLSSLLPRGPWESEILATKLGVIVAPI